jgi:hypothetical protein
MKVTLAAWAARHFEQPPVENTLRIWARQGRIVPTPVKIGRAYYVEPTAQHITEAEDALTEFAADEPEPIVRPVDFDTFSAEDCRHWILSPECQRVPNHEQHAGCAVPGIYALFNGPRLVYIGMSANVGLRLRGHYMSEKLYSHTAFMPIPDYAFKAMEAAHIHALSPPLNARYEPSSWHGHFSMVKMIRTAWGHK